GYAARESVEHTIYEMLTWFDKHVKNAAPRERKEQAANVVSAPNERTKSPRHRKPLFERR
ncbi:MAG: hypothetical protein M3371_15405, partial [Acidobacteriota bacterium]|nr:hypothetical protein [Acidobacteriota bacterium]